MLKYHQRRCLQTGAGTAVLRACHRLRSYAPQFRHSASPPTFPKAAARILLNLTLLQRGSAVAERYQLRNQAYGEQDENNQ